MPVPLYPQPTEKLMNEREPATLYARLGRYAVISAVADDPITGRRVRHR